MKFFRHIAATVALLSIISPAIAQYPQPSPTQSVPYPQSATGQPTYGQPYAQPVVIPNEEAAIVESSTQVINEIMAAQPRHTARAIARCQRHYHFARLAQRRLHHWGEAWPRRAVGARRCGELAGPQLYYDYRWQHRLANRRASYRRDLGVQNKEEHPGPNQRQVHHRGRYLGCGRSGGARCFGQHRYSVQSRNLFLFAQPRTVRRRGTRRLASFDG